MFNSSPKEIYELEEKFQAHIESYGFSYGTKEEYFFRREIFFRKDGEINHWNNKQDSFRLQHNRFSTMTDDEMSLVMGSRKSQSQTEPTLFDDSDLADSIDWRAKGGVNPVRDQQFCGSCWAFGATSCTETAHFIATGKLLSLSEQQLVSCDKASIGCKGGYQDKAFDHLKTVGQALESEYPYVSGDGLDRTCDSGLEALGKVNVLTNGMVTPNSVAQLKAAINQGAVTNTIEGDKMVFAAYGSGILDDPSCGYEMNHAVTSVGYGNENGKDYYIVRNSWGADWGDKGYIKIAAVDGPGICGIQMQSYFATTN